MITAFPKIFSLGTDYIRDIFKGPVQVTEKVDGSQFAFGVVNGKLYCRSKGKLFSEENFVDKMFSVAVARAEAVSHLCPDNVVFYCEYLQRPKHNTLVYERTPKNNLMMFAAMRTDCTFLSTEETTWYADEFGFEMVPVIYEGEIESSQQVVGLIDRVSVLGNAKIEGVVVKNFNQPFLLGGQPIPLMSGKFVSEGFKEVHRNRWGKEETTKGRMEIFYDSFCTEARWHKAIQHLGEASELEYQPRDIGKLIKEIGNDIAEEEKEFIKEFLWKEFKGQITKSATNGFPEFYKRWLLERSTEQ